MTDTGWIWGDSVVFPEAEEGALGDLEGEDMVTGSTRGIVGWVRCEGGGGNDVDVNVDLANNKPS